MRRHIARLLGLAATCSLAILWLVSAPTASAGDPCYHGFEMPTTTIEATNEIKVMPCAFGPTVARVPVGSTVTFFNGPDFAHLVTGADQAWGSRDTGQHRFLHVRHAGCLPVRLCTAPRNVGHDRGRRRVICEERRCRGRRDDHDRYRGRQRGDVWHGRGWTGRARAGGRVRDRHWCGGRGSCLAPAREPPRGAGDPAGGLTRGQKGRRRCRR